MEHAISIEDGDHGIGALLVWALNETRDTAPFPIEACGYVASYTMLAEASPGITLYVHTPEGISADAVRAHVASLCTGRCCEVLDEMARQVSEAHPES